MKLKQLLSSSGFLLQAQLEIPFTEDQRQPFRNKYRWKENGKEALSGRAGMQRYSTIYFNLRVSCVSVLRQQLLIFFRKNYTKVKYSIRVDLVL